MKNFKYILLLLLPFFLLNSCTDDDADNPSFGDDEIYLYGEWSRNLAKKIDQVLEVEGLSASPGEGVTYKWTLNDEIISTDKKLVFPIKEYYLGASLKYVVTNQAGKSSFREASLMVAKDYVPKEFKKKSVAYFTCTGEVADINWENITHLIISSIMVDEKDGGFVFDDTAIKKMDITTIKAYAHHFGISVSLQFSPVFASSRHEVPQMDGRHLYNNIVFYNAAIKETDKLINAMVAKASEYGVDGVDILMNKKDESGFDVEGLAKLKEFYQKFAVAAPKKVTIDGNEYDYLLTHTMHGGWSRGVMSGVVNLPEYKWVNMTYFGYTGLAPQVPAIVGDTEGAVNAMLAWDGPVAPDRLVLVLPGYGVRYFGIPNDYTWGNIDDLTEYMPYKTIMERYPAATGADRYYTTDNGGDNSKPIDVVYYDGLDVIAGKVAFSMGKNLGGIGLWSIESDSKDPAKSLSKKINVAIGNE